MTDKVQKLPTVKQKANDSLVEMLTDLLELAKAGDVTEAYILGLRPDGDVHTWATPTTQTFKLIGAIEQLKFDVLTMRSKQT